MLVYLLIVVNFQSWLDPFIIITALPAALCRHRALPLLHPHHAQRAGADGRHHVHGRRHRQQHSGRLVRQGAAAEHGDAIRAAIEAGATRFRPVIMTALAMIIGMVPMALGLGEGGEQNAPLGRAVIGGLLRHRRDPDLRSRGLRPPARPQSIVNPKSPTAGIMSSLRLTETTMATDINTDMKTPSAGTLTPQSPAARRLTPSSCARTSEGPWIGIAGRRRIAHRRPSSSASPPVPQTNASS